MSVAIAPALEIITSAAEGVEDTRVEVEMLQNALDYKKDN